MSVYRSRVVARDLRAAHADVAVHVVCSGDGRCVECGLPGPCAARVAGLAVLRAAGVLPIRRPGATRPELIGARRVLSLS